MAQILVIKPEVDEPSQPFVNWVEAGNHLVCVIYDFLVPLSQLSIAARERQLRLLLDYQLTESVDELVLPRLQQSQQRCDEDALPVDELLQVELLTDARLGPFEHSAHSLCPLASTAA